MSPFIIFLSAFLINNIVLMRFLGLCPYFGVSKRTETALGMSMGVFFVMLLASWITFFIYHHILIPLDLVFLRTASFILVIASLVQLIELFLKKNVKTLYRALGIFLPLITTNCAILGITFLIVDYQYTLIQATVFAAGTAMGFGLALFLMAGIREQLELAPVPSALKGAPIAFIVASLTSLAFLGFSGFLGISI